MPLESDTNLVFGGESTHFSINMTCHGLHILWKKDWLAYSFLNVATTLVHLLFIELMSHLSYVKHVNLIHLTHEWILWIQITRGRVHFEESLLPPSFEPVTFQPRPSSICSRTFFTGFGHFHGSTQSGTIQVASTLGYHFAAVTSKLSRSQSRLSQNPSAWLPKKTGFGFCQQHLELPSGLPSKYYLGPMLLNFSVEMGTGVSNMAWSADS